MRKERVYLNEKNFVGITGTTSLLREQDPSTSVITPLATQYFQEEIANNILKRKNPGNTIMLYTNYESNYQGEYLFGIGDEVFEDRDPNWGEKIIIPKGCYLKFTTDPGPYPQIIIDAWQEIWALEEKGELGAERRYNVDFQLHDDRAQDFDRMIIDIFIGIKE